MINMNDITSKLTWKKIARGIGLAVTSVAITNGYLKFEEYVGNKWFCSDHGHLKGESKDVLEKQAIEYDKDWGIRVHLSNREKRNNNFIKWVENCE